MSDKNSEIDTAALKKEIKQELLKREILMGLEEDEIDLFELFGVLLRHWKLVIIFPFLVAVLTALYSLTIPNQFKSSGTIFIHGKGSALPAMLSQFSDWAVPGVGGNSADYFVTLLQSRTLRNQLVNRFGIATSTIIFGDPLPEALNSDMVLEKISGITSVTKSKEGLISISVETTSPDFSAALVKGHLESLAVLAKGPAREKRNFIEAQIKKISGELEKAELALKTFQDENRMVTFDDQSRAIVERLAGLETKQIESDIALKMSQSMLKASENLPGLERLEIKRISEQARLEAIGKAIAEAEGSLAQLPRLGLLYARLRRDLMVKEKVFSTLTEQFEIAKITEAEEGSTFEIIDLPSSPDLKSKPRRSLIVILSGITAGMAAVFLAFLFEFINKRRKAEAAKETRAVQI